MPKDAWFGGGNESVEPAGRPVRIACSSHHARSNGISRCCGILQGANINAGCLNDHRARHDALTGLSNRMGLIDAVGTRLTAARRGNTALALLFLDLDGFKAVNDTYGHAAGDRLLKMVADRLSRMLRATDAAARIGGDEFVLLSETLTHEQAIELGQRLIAAVSTSYNAATIGVSIGIAMAPEHGTDFADLLAVADAALYEAKSRGKSRCCMASPMTNVAALHRLLAKGTGRGPAETVAAA